MKMKRKIKLHRYFNSNNSEF